MTSWIPLAGTLLGALIAVFSGVRADRSRWKRELDRHWRERRFDVYREFLAVMHQQASAARSLACTKGLLEGPSPIEESEGLRQIAEADHLLAPVYETVHMVGDIAVCRAAQEWRRALWDVADCARGIAEASPAAWEQAYAGYRFARNEFQIAVRNELGIPGLSFQRPALIPSTRPPRT